MSWVTRGWYLELSLDREASCERAPSKRSCRWVSRACRMDRRDLLVAFDSELRAGRRGGVSNHMRIPAEWHSTGCTHILLATWACLIFLSWAASMLMASWRTILDYRFVGEVIEHEEELASRMSGGSLPLHLPHLFNSKLLIGLDLDLPRLLHCLLLDEGHLSARG